MDLGLRSRTALVTGASKGIGNRIALALAREGATVVAAARRTELIDEIAAEAKSFEAGSISALFYDLYESEATFELARQAADLVGPIDILINAAGVLAGSRWTPAASNGTKP